MKNNLKKVQIGIIGPEEKNIPLLLKEKYLNLAYALGKGLAEKGAILITGGCNGIVEAACNGAVSVGGITIGTPGPRRGSAISSVVVEICTPIDVGDYLFAGTLSSDVIIVFPGDAGTLAEIAIAYRYRKPLILLKGISEGILEQLFWNVPQDYPQYIVNTVEEGVTMALNIAEEKLNKDSQNMVM